MILVTRQEKETLDKVGLLRYRRTGLNPQEPNFRVVNKDHSSRSKHYYVVEEPEILAFLHMYDGLNLQKIRKDQLEILKSKGLVSEDNIQHPNEYKVKATVYVDPEGQIRCKKISSYMFALNIWKNKKDK